MMKKLLVLQGANINLIGAREREIYGEERMEEIHERLMGLGEKYKVEVKIFHSNIEGELINFMQEEGFGADGLILNAGGYTHTSVGLRDVIEAVGIPLIEVHLSNIYKREDFRHRSYFHDISEGIIIGLKGAVYELAFEGMRRIWGDI